MIECVFTIDYEIYGNGEGSLEELVYEPARELKKIFQKWNGRFVTFVEVAELEMIESEGTDRAIDMVKEQIREFHREGFEIGLHLHPWWYKGRYENGKWLLDYSEYNLCTLPQDRIAQTIDRSIAYLRKVLNLANFVPVSHRAGHLLFQPTRTLADVLSARGIRVDSSVYKGGLWHQYQLDYRRALKNGYYWRFSDSINIPDPQGALLELPIHARMVPTWKMLTPKRIGIQGKGSTATRTGKKMLSRFGNLLSFRRPMKLDFCEMTLKELTAMVERVVQEDQRNPRQFRPIVAIGHTKELVDFETIDLFLSCLAQKAIKISSFEEVYQRCQS
jgi:hypothetical protein